MPGDAAQLRQLRAGVLQSVFADGAVGFAEIHPRDVVEFVGGLTRRYRPGTVELAASALRSLFRFLRAEGLRGDRLEDAVPMVPHRRTGLVRHLDSGRFEQLIASPDSSSPRGLRDRAIILCMVRLGLRASEVVALRLEDLDWRNATVRVRARKTGHGALLPLPGEVGAALAGYLQHARPDTRARQVFVLHRLRVGEPISSSSSSIVGRAVDNALRHAGMTAPMRGADLLRHSLATDLLSAAQPALPVEEAEAGPAEDILARIQEGGDVDKDLRVLFWNGHEDLTAQLVEHIVADIEADTGASRDGNANSQFWKTAFGSYEKPELSQILSPYRGEVHGTDALNLVLQQAVHARTTGELQELDGIALNDKVIQVRNRPRSNSIWAYNWDTRKSERIEVYNGEMGFAKPHPFDRSKTNWSGFRPERFQVQFSTKLRHGVGYGKGLGKTADGRWMPPESVQDNLELAYAVSIHKAQGSEFERIYFVVPKHRRALLSRELFYTGLTRAARHCTLLIEEDIAPLLSMRRLEQSRLLAVNASLFEFNPVPEALHRLSGWYAEGKIHSTLAPYMVRSKSEVIITNMLFERDVPFTYETPLYAPDGTFKLPDFTIKTQGNEWYWEHVGMLQGETYRNRWESKKKWYDEHFPGRLLATFESANLSIEALKIIDSIA